MRLRPVILCITLAAMAVIPALLQDPYWTDVLIFFLIFILFAISLRLVISTGQISFAHPGLAAIGGYCSGALGVNLGFSFWVSLPVAALISVLVSLVIGYPTLRIKGVYFFLVTFMFTSLIAVIIGNQMYRNPHVPAVVLARAVGEPASDTPVGRVRQVLRTAQSAFQSGVPFRCARG